MNKLTLHTLMTGEIVLTITIKGKRFATVSMGTDAKKARENAKTFIEMMKNAPEITDQIT